MEKLTTIFIVFTLTWLTVNGQYYPYNNIANGLPYQPYQPYPTYPTYSNPQSYPFNPYNPNYPNNPMNQLNNYPTNPNFQAYPNNGNCAPLSPPINGVITSFCGNTYGSSCTFSCAAGYTLTGSATLTCLGGNWSANRPMCTASTSLGNGNIIGYWAIPNRRG